MHAGVVDANQPVWSVRMFYELDNLVGKVLLVGVFLAAGAFGVFQFIEWTERYREFNETARDSLGKVEPIEQNFPSLGETLENNEDPDPYGLMRHYEEVKMRSR
jgi:hypothetical protein